MEGQLGLISQVIAIVTNDPGAEPVDMGSDVEIGDVQFVDDDDDNENAISVEKIRRDIMGSPESELKNVDRGK